MSSLPVVTFNKAKTLVGRQSIVSIIGGAGVKQVTTATCAGTIGTSGDLEVIVTGAAIEDSPITLSIPVLAGDTPKMWAQKVRLALAADARIMAAFDLTLSLDADIVLTAKVAAANDATLNIAIDNDTSAGATTAANSADTVAGSASGPQLDLLIDYLGDRPTLDIGRNTGIGADNGPAYTAGTWLKSRGEMLVVRTRELKKVLAYFGSLSFHMDEAACTAYIRDQKDAPNKVGLLSEDDFPCSVYRDPAELAHSKDNPTEITFIIESLKDGPVEWDDDADVS